MYGVLDQKAAEKMRNGPAAARPTHRRHGLSERQLDIVRLMPAGPSNKDIAAALHIAEGSVKVYMSRIFDVLGVDSRFQVALWAMRNAAALDPVTPIVEQA